MPVGTGEFELALGIPLDRAAVAQLFAPHAPMIEADDFWDLSDLDRLPVVCADLVATDTHTLVSGLVRPGMDGAELLALARAMAAGCDHDVLIEDVTFLGVCQNHVLVVHPDGTLDHGIGTADGIVPVPVRLDPALVRIPAPGEIPLRLHRFCDGAH